MYGVCYFCLILMKLEFPRQLIGRYSKAKFNENPSNGSRVVPCGEKGRHDEANNCFSQFLREKPKTIAGYRHKPASRQVIRRCCRR